MSDFQAQLEQARKAGLATIKPKRTSVRSTVNRLMDGGETGQVEILRAVLSEREEIPGWLESAPAHEVAAVLSRWGSVKHAMAMWKKAAKAGG